MVYPSSDEFRQILVANPLEGIVQHYVFEGNPFVFRNSSDAYGLLRRHISEAIGATQENITIVGSARIGFSLAPDRFPRRFSKTSDIDVAVVDREMFDRLWMALLKWNYPRRTLQLRPEDRNWIAKRRKDIYWGWFLQHDVRPHYKRVSASRPLQLWLEFSTKWFNAFRSLSLHKEFASRNVNGRLYRTWEHALLYHKDGLRQIRQKL